jgi:8-oxo-dGTP pyrophosphatase MutT (NUDIX family)
VEAVPASAPTRPQAARVDEAWASLCAVNPRLFDGPILSVLSLDPDAGTITARRENYRWLAVQDTVPTGVRQLGVTGVIVGRDAAGRPHVLLGRRAPQTRSHGGLWELAPSGGLDPPPGEAAVTLGRADVLGALARESREELGLDADWSSAAIVALYRDDRAHNDDLVARLDLPAPIDPRSPPRLTGGAWEYTGARWAPTHRIADPTAALAGRFRPPSLALMRLFGWIGA